MADAMPKPETRRYTFAQPSALNVEVLGNDALTGQGFITLQEGNMIDRVIIDTNGDWDIILKRDGKEVRRWPGSLLRSDQQGPYFPGFPLTVRPGQIQLWAEQRSGTLAANGISVVWQHSLVPVTI